MIRHLRGRLGALLLTLGVIAVGAGCNWNALSLQQQQAISAHHAAEANDGDRFEHLPGPGESGHVSDSSLERLRACEASGRYNAVSSSGAYRGAYQFDRRTWNGVAARWAPRLSGADPAAAAPHDQDDMAAALFSERGRQPWPRCGKRM